MTPLLALEIGCEELPARDVSRALEQMPGLAASVLAAERLGHGEITAVGTPRRLVLLVEDVAGRQEDLVEEFRGPAAAAAYDEDGAPTRAAEGFARGRGVTVEGLVTRDTDAGPYVFARVTRRGEDAPAVLTRVIPRLVSGLSFPRTMFWGPDIRFPRPIRWVLALLGDRVVDFEVAGLEAGRTTWGHRSLAPGPVEVERAENLVAALERARVVLDPEARRRAIVSGLDEEAATVGGAPVDMPDLLEEVTNLVEHPQVFSGAFNPSYIGLPRPVLATTMRVHQRFFPVAGEGGSLLPHFLAVRNGGPDGLDTVRRGNERVLDARLADAGFFYDEDKGRSPDDMAGQLGGVVFMDGLGTMADKVGRMKRLARIVAGMLGLDGDLVDDILRAAALSKADLVSLMVGEFPELEGIMGCEYARLAGEREAVCRAIYEHYLPRHSGDRPPETMAGTILALVDRLDTLAGCFGAGLRPTGSQDPYGLRRGALGVVEILMAARLHLSLDRLLGHAVDGHDMDEETKCAVREELATFIATRLRGLLLDEGHRYDVVDAVLAAGSDDATDVRARLAAASRFVDDEVSADILSLHRRASNLSRRLPGDAASDDVRPELFETDEERQLFRELEAVREKAGPLIEARDYDGALAALAALRDPVDGFLDQVLVMADDEKIRHNRLLLLADVASAAGRIADWSQVVR